MTAPKYKYRILTLLSGLAAIALTAIAVSLWQGNSHEKNTDVPPLIFYETMTINDYALTNKLSPEIVTLLFAKADRLSLVSEHDLSPKTNIAGTRKAQLEEADHSSKNWKKIVLKFLLWGIFLTAVFVMIRTRRMNPARRKALYFAAAFLFGALLGSDPSPMGTVKDAVVLLGKEHMIFPPRMIAFTIMLIFGTILVNKILCGWGCQFGTLQDFIFRAGRDPADRGTSPFQFKIPFRISNTIRAAFFVLMALFAFLWGMDIVSPLDPFKLFSPLSLTVSGICFTAIILLLSFFTYRPWCHFLCPFGFAGWTGEMISVFRIRVDRDTCISCGKCIKSCPSHAMDGIWKNKRFRPDCFLCGVCIENCPAQAISLNAQDSIIAKFYCKKRNSR
ncbi:MAG: 4Fe-4S binding protein [Spirochaetota bacterium]